LDAFGKEIPAQPTPAPIDVPEDFNKDGVVNMADVMLLAQAVYRYDPIYDLNHDGVINMADVMKLAVKFGYTYKVQ